MIEDGVPASSILLFTFTKKAANEIAERVKTVIGDRACGVTVSTYHSFCARQLRRYCTYLDYKDNFSIIDDDDQKKIMKKILNDDNSQEKPEEVLTKISHFKEQYLTPKQAAAKYADDYSYEDALLAYEQYQKHLKKTNVMDFDDLLFNMVSIMEKNEIVRHQIWNKYKYICSDESQDSSSIDQKLIFMLMNPKTQNLCFIGDSDQSIYGFRGSDIERFYKEVFKHHPQVFELGQNYRSTKTIVDAAQTLIQKNTRPDEKHLFTDNETGEQIIHISARSQIAEANFIANQIKTLVASGQMKYSDAAILYRNSYLSRNVEDIFVKEHIPYQIVGGMSFYRRKEIRDLLSFIDFIYNPENVSSLERIINIPKSGLGDKSVEKIISLSLQKYNTYAIINLKTALQCLSEIAAEERRLTKKLTPFITRLTNIHNWMENNEVTPETMIQKIIVTFDYLNYLRDYDEESYEDRAKNVQEFLNVASTYLDLGEFLEDFFVNSEEETEEEQPQDVVKLMTMHASKGLEFRLVFIIDANEKVIPSWRCESEKDIQEERRLFYVAMTRAKENLIICSTNTMIQSGRPRYMSPSSFINQIDGRYVASVQI